MDHELERYHKNNANLDLTISDLRLKLEGLQKEAGAYTRPLFSSTRAVSDTRYTL